MGNLSLSPSLSATLPFNKQIFKAFITQDHGFNIFPRDRFPLLWSQSLPGNSPDPPRHPVSDSGFLAFAQVVCLGPQYGSTEMSMGLLLRDISRIPLLSLPFPGHRQGIWAATLQQTTSQDPACWKWTIGPPWPCRIICLHPVALSHN